MKRFLIEVADGRGGNGVFLVEHRGRALIVADRAQRRAVQATAGTERGPDPHSAESISACLRSGRARMTAKTITLNPPMEGTVRRPFALLATPSSRTCLTFLRAVVMHGGD